MDSDGEEPPSKRHHYERSSTPIRELDPYQLPSLLSEKMGTRENGLDIVEEPITPTHVVGGESVTQREDDTLRSDDKIDGHDPDSHGISNEAMGIKTKKILS
jgi:hypothetical protein